MTKAALREATEADIDALIVLKDAATEGWDPEPQDPVAAHRVQRVLFAHMLEYGTIIAALQDDEPIGFGTAIRREDAWFLSQLFVRPDAQSVGLGARILDELLARPEATGARVRCVVSSSDPRAFGLYLSRGMLPGWLMVQFLRRGAPPVAPESEPDVLVDSDQGEIDVLDREVRGWARTVDHGLLRRIGTGHALRREGQLAAFAYVQPNGRVGPLVARDESSLIEMVDLADVRAGAGAIWSVASSSPALVRRLLQLGYRPGWISTFCADGAVGPFDRVALAGGAVL
ncbi:MAG: GNAT family N-acetyltransferase [Actinomycetota bacterium]